MSQNICGHFWKFLSLPKISIHVWVFGKRVNRGAGYGLEIPVYLIFQGSVKGIEENRKYRESQSRIKKCIKNAI